MHHGDGNNAALLQAVDANAGRILFECEDGETMTYGAVAELATAGSFRQTRRHLVFCLSENTPGGLLGYLSLLCVNAVPMMIAPDLPVEQLSALMVSYRPSYLWLPERRAGEFSACTRQLEIGGYCLLATGAKPLGEPNPSLALLLGTSGSTGSPKFVRLSHGNLLANARSIAAYLGLGADEKPITTLPPGYSYGLSILHSHVLSGCTIALTARTFFDRAFWDFFRKAGATSFGGVPYHYEMLKKLRFFKMDLPSLRYVTQAGGRMEAGLMRDIAAACAEKGIRFFSMYGQTEATARMAYLDPDRVLVKAGSIGRAIPEGRLWLRDEEGRRIEATGIAGELVYAGPNVSLGYAESGADLAAADDNDGVLNTGDLAICDTDGDYVVVGRLKRFLKMFGYRINLQDIEALLQASGHDAACSGRDDFLKVFIADADAEVGRQVKATLVAHLKISPTAIAVYAVATLPRNEAGKVQYGQLNALERQAVA